MSNRKAADTIYEAASLGANTSATSNEFDIYSADEIMVTAVAVSGAAGAYIRVYPIGYIDGIWLPFPAPFEATTGGSTFTYTNAPYTSYLPGNITESPGDPINYTSSAAIITGASQKMYCGFTTKCLGFSRFRCLITNVSGSAITDVKIVVGVGGI